MAAAAGTREAPGDGSGMDVDGPEVGAIGSGLQESSSDGEVSQEDVGGGPGGTAAPADSARVSGKLMPVRELWCVRASAAFPSAEAATRAVIDVLESVWGERTELCGPPMELRVQARGGDFRAATQSPSGLASIIRRPFDGWEAGSLESLRSAAWQIHASLDECLVVKSFGKASNHAKELNWLGTAVEGFLLDGGRLSVSINEFKIGYAVLRNNFARDNGPEWVGAVYGCNLSMEELCAVVAWVEDRIKLKKWELFQELKLDESRRRVVSASMTPDALGYCFKSADHISGSASVLVESSLDISEFEIGEADELPGLEIIFGALGEDLIFDIEPSIRGLSVKGVIRVRVRCALRNEKVLRSRIKKLIRATADVQKTLRYDTSEGPMEVAFHSLRTLRRLETQEGEGGGAATRGRLSASEQEEARRKEALLEDLQAHQLKSAAALDRVIGQVEQLAISQARSEEHARQVQSAMAEERARSEEHARQVHASLAAEQAAALNTVNMLASVFTSFMERERSAPMRLDGQGYDSGGAARSAYSMEETVATEWLVGEGQRPEPEALVLPRRAQLSHFRGDSGERSRGRQLERPACEGRRRGSIGVEEAQVGRRFQLAVACSCGDSPAWVSGVHRFRGRGWTSLLKTQFKSVKGVRLGIGAGGWGDCGLQVLVGLIYREVARFAVARGRSFGKHGDRVVLRRSVFEGDVFNRELRWTLSAWNGRWRKAGESELSGGFDGEWRQEGLSSTGRKGGPGEEVAVGCAFRASETLCGRAPPGPFSARRVGFEGEHCSLVSQHGKGLSGARLALAGQGCTVGGDGAAAGAIHKRAPLWKRSSVDGGLAGMAPAQASLSEGRSSGEQKAVQGQRVVAHSDSGAAVGLGGVESGALASAPADGSCDEGAVRIKARGRHQMRSGKASFPCAGCSSCSQSRARLGSWCHLGEKVNDGGVRDGALGSSSACTRLDPRPVGWRGAAAGVGLALGGWSQSGRGASTLEACICGAGGDVWEWKGSPAASGCDYAYGQPGFGARSPDLVRSKSSGCDGVACSGLGRAYGHPRGSVSPHPLWSTRGVKCCGLRHHGAGGTLQRGRCSHQASSKASRLAPGGGQSGSVRLSALRHRRDGCRAGRGLWEGLGVRVRCGGQQYGGSSVDGSVGRASPAGRGVRSQRRVCVHGDAALSATGYSHDQRPLCSVVARQCAAFELSCSVGAARTSVGGGPGLAGAGREVASPGHCDRGRGGYDQGRLASALAEVSRDDHAAELLGVDPTDDLPSRNAGGLGAQEEAVDYGNPKEREMSVRRVEMADAVICEGPGGGEVAAVASGWEVAGGRGSSRLRLRGGGPRMDTGAKNRTAGLGRGLAKGRQEAAGAGGEATTWEGKCLFWNARQLTFPVEPRKPVGGSREAAAHKKLDKLEQQLDWHAPWLVALVEVSGDLDRMRRLRAWFRMRGFSNMSFLVGEGSSRSCGEGSAEGSIPANGIVLAVKGEFVVVSTKRLEFRTFAVLLLHKPSQRRVAVALLHGASDDRAEGGVDADDTVGVSFSAQLNAAANWCVEQNGVILMDANRVPCRKWRVPAAGGLSEGDRLLRAMTGWSCACCGVGRACLEEARSAVFIGQQLEETGEPRWTRWGNRAEVGGGCSRLDVGLAFGTAVESWGDVALVLPFGVEEHCSEWVSDHAIVVFDLNIQCRGVRGEARPMPVNLGPLPRKDLLRDKRSAWVQLRDITGDEAFLQELREDCRVARVDHRSEVQVLTSRLRAAGEKAVAEARKHARSTGEELRPRSRFDDGSEVKSWRKRLNVALECANVRGSIGRREWTILFHGRSGLHKLCPRFSEPAIERIPWQRVLARCRRQLARAEAFLFSRQAGEDKWLADKCRQIEEHAGDGDMSAHVRTIWKLIGNRGGGGLKLNSLHVGDEKAAPALDVDDPEFLNEAGRIGEKFVRSMDRGSVPNAFAAWLEVFCTRHDHLPGAVAAWRLESEFTYEVFERTLQGMKGKAVGAGGLSVELLIAAAFEVRWMFYRAILSDVDRRCIAPSWRKVIYVLLRKPPPNDAAVVAQRREIALMPQDLKILLQGIRYLSYAKVCARLDSAQYGWRKGMGCADPGVALACVLDQAHRLRHTAWILYIDLANFFPAINRAIACDSELFVGLPEEVTKVLGLIYGGQCGEQTLVTCQYETGGGLGAPFANGVGRLMGCPVSPDSAKILLNSVLLAIKASVAGVHLWPFEGESICQLAYADDWVGLFDDVRELRKALFIWLTWAEIVGARLGIKGLVKTVISGVTFDAGKPRTPKDPGLRDLEGVHIPLLPCEELYKHLGIPRAAASNGFHTWAGFKGVPGVRDKLRAGIRRLGQLRPGRTSLEQFMCISNVLLGGLGGFYCQATVVSGEEFDQIEREWRRCFNRFARRDPSSAALPLYTPSANWVKGRTHLARTGAAALFTTISKLLSDATPSPAQAAVRSAVALSMYMWGCRSDPNRWDWSHLTEELKAASRRKGARYIGDAWMLVCNLLEEGRAPEESRVMRDEFLRVQRWGRWIGWQDGAGELGGPLRPQGMWFRASSRTLFDPRDQGGVGLDVRPLLLKAGVAEIWHLCASPFLGDGFEGRWLRDKKEVEKRFQCRASDAFWKQWLSAIRVLEKRKIRPVRPAATGALRLRCYKQLRSNRGPSEGFSLEATALACRRMRLSGACDLGVEAIAGTLRSTFHPRLQGEGGSVRSGMRDEAATMIVCCLEGVESETVVQWGACGTSTDSPVATEGDWVDRASRWQRIVRFTRALGWPCWAESGKDVDLTEVEAFPPALRLALRARMALGREAKVVEEGLGEKLRDARVAEDVQRRNWAQFCLLQARLGFSHAFSSDASEGECEPVAGESSLDDWGWWKRRTAAAVVTGDGAIIGGCLKEEEPSDSYTGELQAATVALNAAPERARVLLLLDSTSPIKAWLKFRTKGARAKCQYKAAGLLDALDNAVRRHELVYFLWQRSHCGAPANEWADREAEAMRLQGVKWLDGGDLTSSLWALWPARVQGSLFRWAVKAGERHAHAQMLAQAGRLQVGPEEGDWELGVWLGEAGAAAALLREDKLMAMDDGHVIGAAERALLRGQGCPHGCGGAVGSWHHFAFNCLHPRLVEERKLWRAWVLAHRERCDRLHLHKQVESLVTCLGSSHGSGGCSLRSEKMDLLHARRLLCGFVSREASGFLVAATARETFRGIISKGLRVLCLAVALDKPTRQEVERRVSANNLLRKVTRGWRRVVDRSGPFRVAALKQLRFVRGAMRAVCEVQRAAGSMSLNMSKAVEGYVLRLLVLARGEIDRGVDAVGEEAIILWYLQMKWWEAWAQRSSGVVNRRWSAWVPAAEQAMRKLQVWSRGVFVLRLGWESGGANEGEWSGELSSARCRREWAKRAFLRMGGWKRLRAVRKKTIQENESRKWDRMRVDLESFCRSGSCSGRTLEPVPEEGKIEVVIARRSVKRRSTRERENNWKRGRTADGRGRWAVEAVSRVRRRLGSSGWEALVRWAGEHEESWVPFKDLCPDLREEAWRLAVEPNVPWLREWGERREERRERRQARRTVQVPSTARPQGVRKSPRLAELREQKEKLDRALTVVVQKELASAIGSTDVKRIARVWGVHRRGDSVWVKVAWDVAGGLTPGVAALSELPESIRWRVDKYGRYNALRDGASSSMDVC